MTDKLTEMRYNMSLEIFFRLEDFWTQITLVLVIRSMNHDVTFHVGF